MWQGGVNYECGVNRGTWLYTHECVRTPTHTHTHTHTEFIGASVVKNWQCACQSRSHGFDPWVGKIPWRRKRQPTPVLLHEKSRGPGNLVGYSPWGHKSVRNDLATKQQRICTHISLKFENLFISLLHIKYTARFYCIAQGTKLYLVVNYTRKE